MCLVSILLNLIGMEQKLYTKCMISPNPKFSCKNLIHKLKQILVTFSFLLALGQTYQSSCTIDLLCTLRK